MKSILLDMDGVVVDFSGAACKLHGIEPINVISQSDFWKDYGITTSDFWDKINAEGDGWWENLEPLPHFRELIEQVDRIDPNWHFASMPSRCHHSAAGKVKWMQKHLGGKFRRYMLGCSKQLLSKPYSLLIDDLEENVEKFSNPRLGNYGLSILFPQQWNSLSHLSNDPMPYVRERLRCYAE